MEQTSPGPVLTVTAFDPSSRDLELNAAVAAIKEQAILNGQQGILVTRHAR
jgi:hypothetical protein